MRQRPTVGQFVAGALAASAGLLVLVIDDAEPLGSAALVLLAAVASIWRVAMTERGQRRPWGLWAGGACLLATALLGMRTTSAWWPTAAMATGVLVLAASVWLVTGLRDPRNKATALFDALLVAGALAALCFGYRAFEAVDWILALCVMAWVVALVRFCLSAGTWTTATVTFMCGNALAVVAIVALLMAAPMGGPAFALLAAAAVLWIAGALDRSAPQTFVPAAFGREPSLSSRGGVVAAVVCLPTMSLALAFANGVRPAASLLGAIAFVVVVLLARTLWVTRTESVEPTTGSMLLAAAAVVVLVSSIGAVFVNATAQRYTDQQTALLRYQRALWDSSRRIADAAAGTSEVSEFAKIRGLNDLRLATLPVSVDTGNRLRAVTNAWLQTLSAVNIELGGNPSPRRRDAAMLRAARSTDAVVRVLRLTNDRAASRELAAARRARITIAAFGLSAALVVLLLLRSYSRAESRVTTARSQRDATAAAKEETALLLGAATDLVIVLDEDLTMTAVHGAQVRMLFGDSDGSGRSLVDCLDPGFAELGRQQVRALLASTQQTADATWRLRGIDGGTHDVDVRIYDARDRPLVGDIVLAFKDITKRTELAQARQSTTGLDPLTGLPDRAAAQQHVGKLLADQLGDVGLVKLDLDEFRTINEQLGSTAGDEILRTVARRLTRCAAGGYVARVGSNVFVCVVSGRSIADLDRFARDVVSEATQPFELEGFRPTLVHASAGVACVSPSPATDLTATLFRDAEIAMYEAKHEPGNSIRCFNALRDTAARPRVALRSELVAGITDGQMLLQYQPIVRPHTADVVGYEALVRWQHPTLGRISPAEFIPIAERTGLIVELGDWVLHEATRQLAEWDPIWPDHRYVTVNVAAQQLERPNFADRVAEAIRSSGIRPAQLVLEVTETSLITDEIAAAARLTALQQLGVQIAIDDFGTGYSSLNYLNQFAVDIVKLDKSFIDDVASDERTRALVAGIASMANALDLTVVAEGAESLPQVETLEAMGCQLIQGYHYSRPLDAHEIPAFTLRPRPESLREYHGPEAA